MYVQQLETFIRVAEEGSFGWAANTLFISTPAVVQQISLFEEHCGVTLFKRSNRGVQLTPTGQALYEDGKKIIALSNQALARAQQIEEDSKETLRIGTSPIFRARVLIDAMTMAREDGLPLKFEIPNLVAELSQMNNNFDLLGQKCDLLEAIYCDIAWQGQCQFYELFQTPLGVAVNHHHPLAGQTSVTIKDLAPYTITLSIPGVASQLDALRADILREIPHATIHDAETIGQDTIALSEVQPYIFITQKIFQDNHPNLVTIPLETPYTLPYGLIYSNTPSQPVRDLLAYIDDHREALIKKWVS